MSDTPLPEDGCGLTRRTALKLGIVGLAGAAVGTAATAALVRLAGRSAWERTGFLTEEESALLLVICDQIIPRDDVPGAADTGAVAYIDRQLCGPLARHRPYYRRGLDSFRRSCLRVHGTPFQDLAPADRIGFLRSVELGQAPKDLWGDPSAGAFFGMVLAHTMQGFYGSPRHGGNRAYASYRMLGLDYPQVVGQVRHRGARP
jgi:gluconate 2-dehydrogenase gamma chain